MTLSTTTSISQQETPSVSPSSQDVHKPHPRRQRRRPTSLGQALSKVLPFSNKQHTDVDQHSSLPLPLEDTGDSLDTLSLRSQDSTATTTTSHNNDPSASRLAGGILKVPLHDMSISQTYSTTTTTTAAKKSIRFGTLDVLVFDITLGDNPSVSSGAPIAMGPTLVARHKGLDLQNYEDTRPPRRHKQELAVPKSIREDWLRDEGFARGQWREVEEDVLKIQKSRKAGARACKGSVFCLRLFSSSKKAKGRTSVLRK